MPATRLPATADLASSHRPWSRAVSACRAALLAATLGAAAAGAAAQTASFGFYAGARGGGEFTDRHDGDRDLRLDGGGAWSASLDWTPVPGAAQMQLFVSRQRSELPGSAFARSAAVPIDLTYVHLGGRSFIDGDAQRGGAYVVGGLGVTHFSPGLDGLSAETRPSMNLGVGQQWALTPTLALRAELRAYVTLVNSGGGFFCSGGCVFAIQGDTLVQGEAMLGLSVGF